MFDRKYPVVQKSFVQNGILVLRGQHPGVHRRPMQFAVSRAACTSSATGTRASLTPARHTHTEACPSCQPSCHLARLAPPRARRHAACAPTRNACAPNRPRKFAPHRGEGHGEPGDLRRQTNLTDTQQRISLASDPTARQSPEQRTHARTRAHAHTHAHTRTPRDGLTCDAGYSAPAAIGMPRQL